jgi:hypothetical protein
MAAGRLCSSTGLHCSGYLRNAHSLHLDRLGNKKVRRSMLVVWVAVALAVALAVVDYKMCCKCLGF